MEKYNILDICNVYQPSTIPTKKFVNDGLYLVYGANGAIGRYNQYNHEDSEILMACRGATCGAINISEPFSWINGNAMVIHPNGKVSIMQKYLYYCLKSIKKDTIISGTAQPQITRANMRELKIPVCGISQQKYIVSKIEELFSELDNGVETLKKTKQQLEVYRQAVLKEAFENCEKKVPLNSVCIDITDGDHMPPPKSESGIPFIMISNISNNKIIWTNTSYVNEEYYNNIAEKRKPKNGDILYTVTGSFGIPVLVNFDKKFCFQRHIALLRPSGSILQKYLYYALRSPDVYFQASKRATGTAQKTVGLNVLRTIHIPFTEDMNEQYRTVKEIESRLSICDDIEKTVDNALEQTEAMRQSILKSAFERSY